MSSPSFRRHLLRRTVLRGTGLIAAAALPCVILPGRAEAGDARSLAMFHTHTGENIDLVYARDQHYVPEALTALGRFLRDHYSGHVGTMDPAVYDLLYELRRALGTTAPFHVISAYRSPETNEKLRTTRSGGVAKRSLHMNGQAIDVRMPGVPLADLRDAALSLKIGGVGYYPGSQFVHVDLGRVRRW